MIFVFNYYVLRHNSFELNKFKEASMKKIILLEKVECILTCCHVKILKLGLVNQVVLHSTLCQHYLLCWQLLAKYRGKEGVVVVFVLSHL